MRQRDVSKHRIARAFFTSKGPLTQREIRRITRLRRSTVSPCLGELVKDKALDLSVAKDGKTKLYTPLDLSAFRRIIWLRGSTGRRQIHRLANLGLHPLWIRRPRGRPKRRERYSIQDSIKLTERLMSLPRPVWRYIAKKTGMEFEQFDKGEEVHFSYTTRNGQIQEILAAIPRGLNHWKASQRRSRTGGHP